MGRKRPCWEKQYVAGVLGVGTGDIASFMHHLGVGIVVTLHGSPEKILIRYGRGSELDDLGVAYCQDTFAPPALKFLLPRHVARVLEAAGYDDMGKVCQATDEELLAIKGVGPAFLAAINVALNRGWEDA